MHRLTIAGLILALLSITPASVLVCGSVLTPERILQFNDVHDYNLDIDCLPQPPIVNFSTIDFSSFMQHGFYGAFFLIMFAFAGNYRFVDSQLLTIFGWKTPPPTPPPNLVQS